MGTHRPLQRREQQAVILWENRKVDIPTVHNLVLLPFLFNGSQRKSGYTLSRRVNKRWGRVRGSAKTWLFFCISLLNSVIDKPILVACFQCQRLELHVIISYLKPKLLGWSLDAARRLQGQFMEEHVIGFHTAEARFSLCKKMHADSFGMWWCLKAPGTPQIRLF